MDKKSAYIEKAKAYCFEKGVQLTPPRLYVLEIVSQAETPLGAYDILKELERYVANPKPPTVYRAVEFWKEHGFFHKVESLNAYIACFHDHPHQDTHFLVCDCCHSVEEIHEHDDHHHHHHHPVPEGFEAKHTCSETHGTCKNCLHCRKKAAS